MATRTVARLYDTHEDAIEVVRDLEAAGIAHERVNIVAADHDRRYVGDPGVPGAGPPGVGTAGVGSAGLGTPAIGGMDTGPTGIGPTGTGLTGGVPLGAGTRPIGTIDEEIVDEGTTRAGSGAAAGASIGAVIGGSLGMLAGIGAIAIPGVGPVVAAGWLVALIAGAGIGAAAGGLLGSLIGAAVPEKEAHVYSEGVRPGGSLVTVRTDDTEAMRVEQIMAAHDPVDWQTREADYRAAGSDKFDPTAASYAEDEVSRERDRVRSRL